MKIIYLCMKFIAYTDHSPFHNSVLYEKEYEEISLKKQNDYWPGCAAE